MKNVWEDELLYSQGIKVSNMHSLLYIKGECIQTELIYDFPFRF